MIGTTQLIRRAVLCASLLACSTFAACGENRRAEPDGDGGAFQPAPSPLPAPTPQYVATPVPFNLTQSRTFDVFGWDSWPSTPGPSTVQFRWNAAIGKYEVLSPGDAEWSRLEARQDRFGGPPHEYDAFGSGGTKLPFSMVVLAPPLWFPVDGYVGDARIFGGRTANTYFAFGLATEPGDLPVSGTMTCSFGEDEIGSGELVVDPGAGTIAGSVEPFWGGGVRYELVQTSFRSGATTFTAAFGNGGVLEGRFFGPRGVNVAVRAKGVDLNGIMTGTCE